LDPGTPEFIAKYPYQLQEFVPYRNWREIEAQNFTTIEEARSDLQWWAARKQGRRLRIVDMRTGTPTK